jgi:hypothetical protein
MQQQQLHPVYAQTMASLGTHRHAAILGAPRSCHMYVLCEKSRTLYSPHMTPTRLSVGSIMLRATISSRQATRGVPLHHLVTQLRGAEWGSSEGGRKTICVASAAAAPVVARSTFLKGALKRRHLGNPEGVDAHGGGGCPTGGSRRRLAAARLLARWFLRRCSRRRGRRA